MQKLDDFESQMQYSSLDSNNQSMQVDDECNEKNNSRNSVINLHDFKV